MKKKCSVGVFIFIVMIAFYPILANGQNKQPATIEGDVAWRYLGEKIVSFSVGTDFITVKKVGVFRKLKFKVLGAPVKLGGMKVGLENGVVLDIPLQIRVGEDQESKVFDLTGLDSNVKVVYFTYLPIHQGDSRKPKIILLGQQ